MKHILKFDQLKESTSAFSHERAGWGYAPFSFARNYDPRIGYSKEDFCKDLNSIYKEMNTRKRKELISEIFKQAGISRIGEIKNLPNSSVEKLMRGVEKFLKSKSNKKMMILPDGYVVCYEKLKYKKRSCDVHYSPYENLIRVSYTDFYPESEEFLIDPEDMDPKEFGIEMEEFEGILKKCKSLIKKDEEFTL